MRTYGVIFWLALMVSWNGVVRAADTSGDSIDLDALVKGADLTLGGLIEVEATAGRENGEDVSDVTLSTMELGLDAVLSDEWSAGLSLLWEEDDTEPVDLDVAVIKYGGSEQVPYWIEAGRMYVPFGYYDSRMVSDPLVLELGETRASAVSIGYDNDLVGISLSAFNGDMDEANDDDVVDTFVAAASVSPSETITFGVYWMSDLGESDGLEEGRSDAAAGREEYVGIAGGAPVVVPGLLGVPYDEVPGAGAFVSLGVSP